MEQDLRSAAHDLRNIVYRLTFLSENLQREMSPSPARDEAQDLLADSTAHLTRIADSLKQLSGSKS